MTRINIIIAIILTACFAFGQNVTDAAGKKQGYWKKPAPEAGKIIFEGLFKDDKPQGVFKYYYPFDSVKAIMDFRQDGKIAYAKLFHPSGKMMAKGKYISEIKDSVWIYFDEAGIKISKDIYVGGKKNGTSLVYLPDGKVAEERNYKMDIQTGAFKQYYDGKLIKGEGTYVNGLLEGKNTYYYPNGIQAASGFYKNGQKTGAWIYKEKDGKIKEKELYIDGKLADKKKTEEFFSKNKVQETAPKKSEPKKN